MTSSTAPQHNAGEERTTHGSFVRRLLHRTTHTCHTNANGKPSTSLAHLRAMTESFTHSASVTFLSNGPLLFFGAHFAGATRDEKKGRTKGKNEKTNKQTGAPCDRRHSQAVRGRGADGETREQAKGRGLHPWPARPGTCRDRSRHARHFHVHRPAPSQPNSTDTPPQQHATRGQTGNATKRTGDKQRRKRGEGEGTRCAPRGRGGEWGRKPPRAPSVNADTAPSRACSARAEQTRAAPQGRRRGKPTSPRRTDASPWSGRRTRKRRERTHLDSTAESSNLTQQTHRHPTWGKKPTCSKTGRQEGVEVGLVVKHTNYTK